MGAFSFSNYLCNILHITHTSILLTQQYISAWSSSSSSAFFSSTKPFSEKLHAQKLNCFSKSCACMHAWWHEEQRIKNASLLEKRNMESERLDDRTERGNGITEKILNCACTHQKFSLMFFSFLLDLTYISFLDIHILLLSVCELC